MWGILNNLENVSILNVTKYAEIANKGDISLVDVRMYRPLYAKLNYGTLGHYSSPAIFWGILDKKGIYLTDLGNQLAKSWAYRENTKIQNLTEAWLSKKKISEINNFKSGATFFKLSASFSPQEQATWRDIINTYCCRNPIIQPLWQNPISKYDLALCDEEKDYPKYFPAIIKHYEKYPELCERVALAQKFDLLAALSQFVFEWEYVRRLDEVKIIGLYAPQKDAILRSLITHAADYISSKGYKDAGKVFRSFAQAQSPDDIVNIVLSHHADHQRSKGASPFIQGSEVLIHDRIEPKKFSNFIEELRKAHDVEQKIAWRYRRDWHFRRAATWLQYAGGI